LVLVCWCGCESLSANCFGVGVLSFMGWLFVVRCVVFAGGGFLLWGAGVVAGWAASVGVVSFGWGCAFEGRVLGGGWVGRSDSTDGSFQAGLGGGVVPVLVVWGVLCSSWLVVREALVGGDWFLGSLGSLAWLLYGLD